MTELENIRQAFNIYAEKPEEHLPTMTVGDASVAGDWVLRCACGLEFRLGDRWSQKRTGKPPINRKIRTTTDARHAHMVHYEERTRSH